MESKFLKLYGTDVEMLIDGEKVLFEQDTIETIENRVTVWNMNGIVNNKVLFHATGEYELESDEFIDLTNIEAA